MKTLLQRKAFCVLAVAQFLLLISIECSKSFAKHNILYTSSNVTTPFKFVQTKTGLIDLLDFSNEPNAFFWKESRESIPRNLCTEISAHYKIDRIIDIGTDVSVVAKYYELDPANYDTVVIVDLNREGKKQQNVYDIFSLFDYFLNNGVYIDNFVFYNIENIQLASEEQYKNCTFHQVVSNIVFHNSSVETYIKVYDYFSSRSRNGIQITIDCCDGYIFGQTSMCTGFLSSIASLRLRNFSSILESDIAQMPNLESLWIFSLKPGFATSVTSSHEKVKVKNLYIHIDLLKKHSHPFLLSSIFRSIDSLTIAIPPIKDDPKSAAKDFYGSNAALDDLKGILTANNLPINFMIENEAPLTPTEMSLIFSMICNCNLHTYKICIRSSSFGSRKALNILQVPLYYSAQKMEDRIKLDKCVIIVLQGANDMGIQMKQAPSLKHLTIQEVKNKVLENCTAIIEINDFLQYLNSSLKRIIPLEPEVKRDGSCLEKPLPRCLSLLYNKKLKKKVKCMHCNAKIKYKKFQSKKSYEYVMLYPCGHVSCAPCGYMHVSQGFKELPKCIKCTRMLGETMLYIRDNEIFDELQRASQENPEKDLYSALDPLITGFIFSYGPGPSSILYALASFFAPNLDSENQWIRFPFEKNPSYGLGIEDSSVLKCRISMDSRKQEVIVTIDIVVDEIRFNNISIFIRKKTHNMNRHNSYLTRAVHRFIEKIKYVEILADKIPSEFVLLYKRKFNDAPKIAKELEKTIGKNLHTIDSLCTFFWNSNGWA